MNPKLPHRNKSPHGWWVASYVLRACWSDEPQPVEEAPCQVWENTIILQAEDRDAAFEKAVRLASQDDSEFQDPENPVRVGRWVYEGLTSLLPIYEELRDGAEILWVEHNALPLAKLRSWVKDKAQLEAFDDTPSIGDDA